MKWISAQEVIAFHDRILAITPGVKGMREAGRAEAIIYRVQNLVHYQGEMDVFELAAMYWTAIARGHIFNDGNKRTAVFIAMAFLKRNGVTIRNDDTELEDVAVNVATGELSVTQLAEILRLRVK